MSYQPGTRGSMELCPPYWQLEPHTGMELGRVGHTSTLHRPTDWQFQLLKGAEEDQVVTAVIRAVGVGFIPWVSPTLWTQVAGKEKLRTSIPTVSQRNIVNFLLHAVRIRRDDKDGVLHITTLDIRYNQVHTFMNIVYRMHIHIMYMYVQCI